MTYAYTKALTKELKAHNSPASKSGKVKAKKSMKKADKYKYHAIEEQLDDDTMFFGEYLHEFSTSFIDCMRAYPGGTTHAANMSVHLIKAGVAAVKKARLAGRHPEQFRLLAALTNASFDETMWYRETEDSDKEIQKLMNLIGKEWQQLLGSRMWNPAALKLQSKKVLDQIVLSLEEYRESVQEWAKDVEYTTSFKYTTSTDRRGKKLPTAMKRVAKSVAKKTGIMKVMKTSMKTAKKK